MGTCGNRSGRSTKQDTDSAWYSCDAAMARASVAGGMPTSSVGLRACSFTSSARSSASSCSGDSGAGSSMPSSRRPCTASSWAVG